MAQYTITNTCGHTYTYNLFGPGKDRDRKIAWLKTEQCPNCRNGHQTAPVADPHVANSDIIDEGVSLDDTDTGAQFTAPASSDGRVRVTVDKANFAKGVKYAKQFGGQFDGATKTWTIPANRPELGNLRAYGLIRIAQ